VLLTTLPLAVQPSWAESKEADLEEMMIFGVRQRLYDNGMLKDVIQKTEVISNVLIEQTNASNLSEAIANAPGVRVNNECSMCGVKRVMLNGLRGEHTTILVDGIPTYTMMSGFYGMDAASTASIERIEIARGAGASLTAPEAIGGTINLISRIAESNTIETDISGGENGYVKAVLLGTLVAKNESTRITGSAQFDQRDIYDGDDNGVGENPALDNATGTVFLSQDFGSNDNLHARVSFSNSEILGGPTGIGIDRIKAGYSLTVNDTLDQLFENGDVRNQFIGHPWETTEWIESDRLETYASWLHEFNMASNITLTYSRNTHEQDSFYEGFIYQADNTMQFSDIRVNLSASDAHHLTFGTDMRIETLESEANSDSPDYVSDSFDYDTIGIYLQDTWTLTNAIEIAAALRYDQVTADFTDPKKSGTEIDESLLSPRIDMRFNHNDQWVSRFSAGQGYRAPLSFFESDHGILDAGAGFEIDINKLERSESYNYTLSFDGALMSASGSLASTRIDNLASLSENDQGIPVLTQMTEQAEVVIADLALSYSVLSNLNLSATIESMHYNHTFKQSFGVVPAEKRVISSLDWDINGWDLFVTATWIGKRDLKEYGTPENPTFDVAGTQPKSQQADAYWTADFRLAKEWKNRWQFYLGATNLFDFTQVNDMETPLFYEDGGFDVAHIYGPLRGREFYAGVKWTL